MKKRLVILFLMLSTLFATAANAATETNKVLTLVGVQGNNAYFKVQGGFTGANCLYDNVYVPITEPDGSSIEFGKFAYAQLLTALSTTKRLFRIDYAVNAGGICVLTLVNSG